MRISNSDDVNALNPTPMSMAQTARATACTNGSLIRPCHIKRVEEEAEIEPEIKHHPERPGLAPQREPVVVDRALCAKHAKREAELFVDFRVV